MAGPGLKKKHAGGHGDSERWLVTYSDMITLLMAFFIMMYAMSVVNMGKFEELAVSVRSGFGGPITPIGANALGIPSHTSVLPTVLPANSFELMSKIAGSVRNAMGHENRGDVEFLSEDGRVTIRVRADNVLFARGSADISPYAARVLAPVAQVLKSLPHQVRVEGHTCDLPIRTSRFASNWELSAQRAINVVLHLIRQEGLSVQRLSAAGYADTVPVVPNTCEENRARNRRIDIVLLEPTKAGVPSHDERSIDELKSPTIAPPPINVTATGGGLAPVPHEMSRPEVPPNDSAPQS